MIERLGSSAPLLLLSSVLLLMGSNVQAGPTGLIELLTRLQEFFSQHSEGISSQDAILFDRLVNNARVGIQSQVSMAATDKALEAIRLLLRRLREESENSDQQMARNEALQQVEEILETLPDLAIAARLLSPFDPEPLPPAPESCTVEILQIVRSTQLGRIVNGRFALQSGSILDLQAQGNPAGGMTRWELDPVPQEFDNGGFSTSSPNCTNCGDGNLRFFAPTGPEGRRTYLITAIYTAPSGLICRDQMVILVR